MSDGDIFSNDEIYGGFEAMIANDLHCGEEGCARCWEEERLASA